MKPLLIRPIQLSDVEKLVELEEKYLGETIGSQMLENEMNNKYALFLVGEVDGVVIGYLGAWLIEATAEIINFVVDQAYWHKGFGQALWKALELEAKLQSCHNIILEVKETNNRALNFYEKQGLKPVGRRNQYYQDDSDAIVMMKVNI